MRAMHTDSLPRELQGSRVLDAKADIRKTSELNPDGGEESSPRMAKNMAMTPADKAELARLDVGWMLSKWRMMRRLSAERTSWMGCFVPKNETAHAVERGESGRGLWFQRTRL